MQNSVEFDRLIGDLKVADEAVTQQLTLLAEAVSFMESMGSKLQPNSEAVVELRMLIRLMKLFLFYYGEAARCFQSESFFAANVMGAAGLETYLLLRCVTEKTKVESSSRWKLVRKKSQKSFMALLSHTDLGTLLQLAFELSWLPKGGLSEFFKQTLTQHFGSEMAEKLLSTLPETDDLVHFAALVSKDMRNKLHPAWSIREPFELSVASGMAGSFCLLIALTSLIESWRGPKSAPS